VWCRGDSERLGERIEPVCENMHDIQVGGNLLQNDQFARAQSALQQIQGCGGKLQEFRRLRIRKLMPNKLYLGIGSPTLELNEPSALGLDEASVPESPSQLASGVELKYRVGPNEDARLATSPKSDEASLRVARQPQFHAPDQGSRLVHQVFSILCVSRHVESLLENTSHDKLDDLRTSATWGIEHSTCRFSGQPLRSVVRCQIQNQSHINTVERRMAAPNEEVIQMLKEAYSMELETVMNYLANSTNLDGVRAEEIKKSLAADITEELTHAQLLGQRIKQIGGVLPGSAEVKTCIGGQQQPPADTTDVMAVIEAVIAAEKAACSQYKKIIRATDGEDYVTQDLCIRLLASEEEHLVLFRGFLKEYSKA